MKVADHALDFLDEITYYCQATLLPEFGVDAQLQCVGSTGQMASTQLSDSLFHIRRIVGNRGKDIHLPFGERFLRESSKTHGEVSGGCRSSCLPACLPA